MNDTEINDIRTIKEFKSISFSNFKKTDVFKELNNSILNIKLESAIYWTSEIICAGHFLDLWDFIINFYSKSIHIGNVPLVIFIELKINQFKSILNNGYQDNILKLRNYQPIRELFIQIIYLLIESSKKYTHTEIKIRPKDFDLQELSDRFKAPHNRFQELVFLEDDPKSLFIICNELIYNLQEIKDNRGAIFWVEWLINYVKHCKKKNEIIIISRRNFKNIHSNFQKDPIWMIWDIFFKLSHNNKVLRKIVDSSFTLFSLKYSPSVVNKRKYLIYFLISVYCDNLSFSGEMINQEQKENLALILKNIDKIFSQIKKNEITPGTDYLFKNQKQRNLEQTIEKLETLNSFHEDFIPRL
jgi:hypothetical protein